MVVYGRRRIKRFPVVTRSELNHNQSIITTTFPQDVWTDAHRSGAGRPHLESVYNRVASHYNNNNRPDYVLTTHSCEMVAQVVHIPILNYMSHLFQITYLCDVSAEALEHSQLKVAGAVKPKTTIVCEKNMQCPGSGPSDHRQQPSSPRISSGTGNESRKMRIHRETYPSVFAGCRPYHCRR